MPGRTLQETMEHICWSIDLLRECSEFQGISPEHRRELIKSISERVELQALPSFPSFSSDDPFILTRSSSHPLAAIGRIVFYAQGSYLLEEDALSKPLRLGDSFDFFRRVMTLRDIVRWESDAHRISLRGQQRGEAYEGKWSLDNLTLEIAHPGRGGLRRASFANGDALRVFEDVMPRLVRLVAMKRTDVEYDLGVEYLHNPGVIRDVSEVTLSFGQEVRRVAEEALGTLLARTLVVREASASS